MSTSDYRRGFEDARSVATKIAAAMEGPDRTQYEFLGGPKSGQRIQTMGDPVVKVAVPTPINSLYSPAPYADDVLRTGEYRREEIGLGGRRRTVYIWQGER